MFLPGHFHGVNKMSCYLLIAFRDGTWGMLGQYSWVFSAQRGNACSVHVYRWSSRLVMKGEVVHPFFLRRVTLSILGHEQWLSLKFRPALNRFEWSVAFLLMAWEFQGLYWFYSLLLFFSSYTSMAVEVQKMGPWKSLCFYLTWKKK